MKKPQFTFPRRDVHGLILLDKPIGLSSNQALQKVRNLFKAEKAGHTGALDPLATGVLPICLGEATKVAGHLLGNDKAYEVTGRLGASTDTDDSEGQILLERTIGEYPRAQLESILQGFIGNIQQVPPIYSALKQGGEPMYLKARRGETIELPARPISIHSIEVLAQTDDSFRLSVVCGSGTYIRSLVRDIGESLGCGAHVSALRRTWVEPFQATHLWTWQELQDIAALGQDALDAQLIPVEQALVAIPRLVLDATQVRRVGMGQKIHITGMNEAHDLIQLCDENGRALGLASINTEGVLKLQRLFRWAAIS